jgi:hypothetical protein
LLTRRGPSRHAGKPRKSLREDDSDSDGADSDACSDFMAPSRPRASRSTAPSRRSIVPAWKPGRLKKTADEPAGDDPKPAKKAPFSMRGKNFDPTLLPHPNNREHGCVASAASLKILDEDLESLSLKKLRELLAHERNIFINKFGKELSTIVRNSGGQNAAVNEFYLARQSNAWMTSVLMSQVVRDVIKPTMEASKSRHGGITKGKRALLMLDNCSVHKDNRFINECLANGIDVFFFYPNSTAHLQPLDISYNRPLKSQQNRRGREAFTQFFPLFAAFGSHSECSIDYYTRNHYQRIPACYFQG